jgi:hypothetical protein
VRFCRLSPNAYWEPLKTVCFAAGGGNISAARSGAISLPCEARQYLCGESRNISFANGKHISVPERFSEIFVLADKRYLPDGKRYFRFAQEIFALRREIFALRARNDYVI